MKILDLLVFLHFLPFHTQLFEQMDLETCKHLIMQSLHLKIPLLDLGLTTMNIDRWHYFLEELKMKNYLDLD